MVNRGGEEDCGVSSSEPFSTHRKFRFRPVVLYYNIFTGLQDI